MTEPAKEKHAGGRKNKLTDEVKKNFLQAIRVGATYELACAYSGIHYNTFCNWQKRKSQEFVEFLEDVRKAEGNAAIKWLALIEKHSEANPQWAAWKLERRYPHAYGRQVTEVTGKDGKDLPAPSNVIIFVPDNGRENSDTPPGGATN